MVEKFALYTYRQRVSEDYYQVRHSGRSQDEILAGFRARRDNLFATHPRSALSETQKRNFSGLSYYPHDPALRFVLPLARAENPSSSLINLRQDGEFSYEPLGTVQFEIDQTPCELTIFWIQGYGGGLFLPFRDTTSGNETYGGGRYLLDTIKGADLGQENGSLVIDFNYAYHPSCAYNEAWHCPLAPANNILEVPIRAGETLGRYTNKSE